MLKLLRELRNFICIENRFGMLVVVGRGHATCRFISAAAGAWVRSVQQLPVIPPASIRLTIPKEQLANHGILELLKNN